MKAKAHETKQMKATGLSLEKVRMYRKQLSYTKKGSGRVHVQGAKRLLEFQEVAYTLAMV